MFDTEPEHDHELTLLQSRRNKLLNAAEDLAKQVDAKKASQDDVEALTAIMHGEYGGLKMLDSLITQRRNDIRVQGMEFPPSAFTVDGRDAGLVAPQARVRTPTLTAFKGKGASNDAYDCGLWLQAHVGGNGAARARLESRRGTAWMASQSEYNPTSGGYLVPSPMEKAVIVSRRDTGALRKLARIVPMSTGDSLKFPKQSDGTTVYYPGEEGSITASDLDFGQVTLQTKKRAIYSLFSSELRDDALVSIADLLAADMGHQFALKEDSEFIDGDGGSSYGGVSGVKALNAAATASIATAATGHDTWAELDFSDFAAVMALLPAKYRAGNNLAWLCSPAFKWAVMDRLTLGANGALSQMFVDGQPQDRFLGYPVVLSDFCPTATAAATACCWFGNWQRAVLLGDRTEVRIATSEHIAFQNDQIAVRGTVRYDIGFHEPGDTTNAGAVVSLKTAS